jgi:hypothetical protein
MKINRLEGLYTHTAAVLHTTKMYHEIIQRMTGAMPDSDFDSLFLIVALSGIVVTPFTIITALSRPRGN